MLQLHVRLLEIDPPIWRRLTVSETLSLGGLHRILQVAFGWQDYHVHAFRRGQRGAELRGGKVGDLLRGPGDSLIYEYDFGDSWEHEVTLEKALDISTAAPTCLGGERAAPPEDSGGTPGYENLIEVLGDSSHPDHAEMREWAGDWDPERFDLEAVNNRLASLGRRG